MSESMINEIDLSNTDVNTWKPTMNLRWKDIYGDGLLNNAVLQQMWISDKGEERWEQIEFIK